jgi:hypothetical protein
LVRTYGVQVELRLSPTELANTFLHLLLLLFTQCNLSNGPRKRRRQIASEERGDANLSFLSPRMHSPAQHCASLRRHPPALHRTSLWPHPPPHLLPLPAAYGLHTGAGEGPTAGEGDSGPEQEHGRGNSGRRGWRRGSSSAAGVEEEGEVEVAAVGCTDAEESRRGRTGEAKE